METNQAFVYFAIICYLALILYIGYYCSKQNENSDDFYLGGRRLGPVVAAMSAEASDMSSWLLLGIPGLTLFTGIADTFWTSFGLAIGTYLNWLLVAERLRSYSERVGAITIPDFFARRFHDKGNALLGIAALTIIVFFIHFVMMVIAIRFFTPILLLGEGLCAVLSSYLLSPVIRACATQPEGNADQTTPED